MQDLEEQTLLEVVVMFDAENFRRLRPFVTFVILGWVAIAIARKIPVLYA